MPLLSALPDTLRGSTARQHNERVHRESSSVALAPSLEITGIISALADVAMACLVQRRLPFEGCCKCSGGQTAVGTAASGGRAMRNATC